MGDPRCEYKLLSKPGSLINPPLWQCKGCGHLSTRPQWTAAPCPDSEPTPDPKESTE